MRSFKALLSGSQPLSRALGRYLILGGFLVLTASSVIGGVSGGTYRRLCRPIRGVLGLCIVGRHRHVAKRQSNEWSAHNCGQGRCRFARHVIPRKFFQTERSHRHGDRHVAARIVSARHHEATVILVLRQRRRQSDCRPNAARLCAACAGRNGRSSIQDSRLRGNKTASEAEICFFGFDQGNAHSCARQHIGPDRSGLFFSASKCNRCPLCFETARQRSGVHKWLPMIRPNPFGSETSQAYWTSCWYSSVPATCYQRFQPINHRLRRLCPRGAHRWSSFLASEDGRRCCSSCSSSRIS